MRKGERGKRGGVLVHLFKKLNTLQAIEKPNEAQKKSILALQEEIFEHKQRFRANAMAGPANKTPTTTTASKPPQGSDSTKAPLRDSLFGIGLRKKTSSPNINTQRTTDVPESP